MKVQGALKRKFGHYCDAFNLYIKYHLRTWWTDSHVWQIKNLQETLVPFVVCHFFASTIMKVTENLIYISEIISSNFLFCQNFVSPSCSLSLLNLLLSCFAVKPDQPVCWFHEVFTTARLGEGCCRLSSTISQDEGNCSSTDTDCFPSAWHDYCCTFWETLCSDYLTWVLFIVLLM